MLADQFRDPGKAQDGNTFAVEPNLPRVAGPPVIEMEIWRRAMSKDGNGLTLVTRIGSLSLR